MRKDFKKRQVSEAWSHVASGKSLFAPEARSRMKCGTKITPCGDAAWGCARKEHALAKRNCPAGTPRRETVERFGRLRLSGAAHVRGVPQARASPRAWGYVCFAPSGRGKSLKLKGLKLKGKFVGADFEEADRSSFGKNSRNSCNSWIQKIRGSLRDPRENLHSRISRKRQECRLSAV